MIGGRMGWVTWVCLSSTAARLREPAALLPGLVWTQDAGEFAFLLMLTQWKEDTKLSKKSVKMQNMSWPRQIQAMGLFLRLPPKGTSVCCVDGRPARGRWREQWSEAWPSEWGRTRGAPAQEPGEKGLFILLPYHPLWPPVLENHKHRLGVQNLGANYLYNLKC